MALWAKSALIWLVVALGCVATTLMGGLDSARLFTWRYYVWWEEDRSAEMRSQLDQITQHVEDLKQAQLVASASSEQPDAELTAVVLADRLVGLGEVRAGSLRPRSVLGRARSDLEQGRL